MTDPEDDLDPAFDAICRRALQFCFLLTTVASLYLCYDLWTTEPHTLWLIGQMALCPVIGLGTLTMIAFG